MFGKPQWFRKNTRGWGLVPITWQGWGYTALVAALMAMPFNMLLFSRGVPEALLWVLAASGAIFLEVRSIRRQIDRAARNHRDVLYIGDDEHDTAQTSKLDLQLRR